MPVSVLLTQVQADYRHVLDRTSYYAQTIGHFTWGW